MSVLSSIRALVAGPPPPAEEVEQADEWTPELLAEQAELHDGGVWGISFVDGHTGLFLPGGHTFRYGSTYRVLRHVGSDTDGVLLFARIGPEVSNDE